MRKDLEHFGFLCGPTMCGAKTSRHGRDGILGHFGDTVLGHCLNLKYIPAVRELPG